MILEEIRLPRLQHLLLLLVVFFFATTSAAQTAPQVLKVEPPSWWAGSSLNPVRVMIRGKSLENSRVQVIGSGMRLVGRQRSTSAARICSWTSQSRQAHPAGTRRLKITTRWRSRAGCI